MKDKTRGIAEEVLALSEADQTEVIVTEGVSALTRFADGVIHQNVAWDDLAVAVRAVVGKRVGAASSNDVSKAGLKALAEKALETARTQAERPDFPGLPAARPVAEVEAYSRETAAMTPAVRAKMAASVIDPAREAGAAASGTVADSRSTLTVMNSRGLHASTRASRFEAMAVISKDGGSGWAGGVSWSRRRVDVRRIARTALEKCLASSDPQPLEPGEYTVILEPHAVADLISYTAYMGFGAQSFTQGRSFLTGKIGQKIMHGSISIWDDGLDEEGMPTPFDLEGVPKRRVSLVEKGMAAGVVYDTYYAAKAGVESTGHSLGPGFLRGPLPTNLFMAAGTSSLEKMIASTERGVLVTRFHYTNVADPMQAALTGLTRDGTFLIENGQIAHPVKNLRFTQSMTRAFSAVEAISSERSLESAILGPALVPAVKISSFRFTGATEF